MMENNLREGERIDELQRNGYDVPGDISVVGYDDYLHPGLCNVEITSYGVDMGQMAALGINLLIRKIQGKTYRKGFHIVEGYFVERESGVFRCGWTFHGRLSKGVCRA